MKKETNIQKCFQPVVGTQPWRVKPGVGSFLTVEFGPRVKEHGHIHGQWHLWIYLSNWVLSHNGRQLVNSDTDRRVIGPAVRRLEEVPLTGVEYDSRGKKTSFLFDDFKLVVTPADYLEDADDRDSFWMFFMPKNRVLIAGPSGLRLEKDEASSATRPEERQEDIDIRPPKHRMFVETND